MNLMNIQDRVLDRIRRHSIRKYGLEAMSRVFEVSRRMGRPVWLEYGTLLGAYREHGFIPHDFDIDLGMMRADYDYRFQQALYDSGFKILRQFTLVDATNLDNRWVTEVTLKYRQVQIDLFLRFQEDGQTFNYLWKKNTTDVNRWYANRDAYQYTGFKEADFLGIKVNVPENTRDYLEFKYGADFMTPQPGWKPREKVYLPIDEYYGEVLGGWIG